MPRAATIGRRRISKGYSATASPAMGAGSSGERRAFDLRMRDTLRRMRNRFNHAYGPRRV